MLRSLPGWRGGLARTAAASPGLAVGGTALLAAQGRRSLARRG